MRPCRGFAPTKDVRDGMDGGDFLGRKELICQPVTSLFYWSILIQLLPNSGRVYPQRSFFSDLLLNYDI